MKNELKELAPSLSLEDGDIPFSVLQVQLRRYVTRFPSDPYNVEFEDLIKFVPIVHDTGSFKLDRKELLEAVTVALWKMRRFDHNAPWWDHDRSFTIPRSKTIECIKKSWKKKEIPWL